MTKITKVCPAGPYHQVVTVEGGQGAYRRRPCAPCPWRVDNTGTFPAEAFRHSASTTYDMAEHVFSCHESGLKKPSTCAGFLLRGADHNLTVRIHLMTGKIGRDVADAGLDLHDSYRDMAIANGVQENDPVLARCR